MDNTKDNKISLISWIYLVTSTVIATVLVAIFIGLWSFIKTSESNDITIQLRQVEFQKDIQDNTTRSKENKKEINDINVSRAMSKTTQKHLSIQLEKLNTNLNSYIKHKH